MIASKIEKILQFPYVVQEHRTAADADYFTTVNKNKSSVVINVACSCLKLKRHQHATRAGVVCLLYLIVQPLTYQWYINQTKNMKARKVFYRLVFIVVFCILKVNKRYRPLPFTINWLASLKTNSRNKVDTWIFTDHRAGPLINNIFTYTMRKS